MKLELIYLNNQDRSEVFERYKYHQWAVWFR